MSFKHILKILSQTTKQKFFIAITFAFLFSIFSCQLAKNNCNTSLNITLPIERQIHGGGYIVECELLGEKSFSQTINISELKNIELTFSNIPLNQEFRIIVNIYSTDNGQKESLLYTGTSLITLNEELTKIQINLQKKEDGSSGGEDGTQIIDSLSAKLVDHNNDTVLGIGDLILSNQKVLPYSTTYTQDDWNNFAHKDKVIAVICVEKKSDSFPAIGLGLLQKDDLIWAATTATCYSASVDNQICTVKKNGEELSTYGDNYNKDTFSFEGRSYGSNGWKEIENKDTSATDNTNKYPIFNYALNYGNTDKLQNSNYKNGWFIPSIKELANISENVSIVNSVLRNLGTEYAQELVFSEYYWSSSQYPGTENAESVWVFSFNENPEEHFVIGTGKNDTKDMNTLVVHEFAGQ